MKKLTGILLVFCILIFIEGCSIQGDKLDKNNTIASSSKEVIATEDSKSTENSDKVAAWPIDNWSTSTPEKQGVQASILSDADKRINENYPNIYSVLVIRHGYLVYEKYYQGMDENSHNPIYSVTKSVMSTLTGIAMRDKLIGNVDQKVADILPEYFAQVDDDKKKDITIKNVLTMTGGLETIDTNYYQYFTSQDWLAFTLEKPLDSVPGSKFSYNTGLTQLLSGIITKSSKMTTLEFAEKNLFEPLGIAVETWNRDSAGYYGGGSGLSLPPRDMAKLGYLYLKNGMWNGKQILSSEWVKEATNKQVTINEDTDYGYLFWIWDSKAKVNGKTYYTYAATGAGGQYIMIVPDLDLVTVITANENSKSKDNSDTSNIFWDYVIPAIK